jgi:heme-degrading monooxygenase HmoA
MFVRVTWTQLATPNQAQVDQTANFLRERILPSLQTRKGFLGAAFLANAETGEGGSVTYWESAEAMAASEAMGTAGRVEAMQAVSGMIKDVDRFEMLLQDRAGPVQSGSFVRVNDVPASLARIDAALAWTRDTALPKVKSLSGYRALLVSANRTTGRMLISSVWDSAADRQASEAGISGLRGQLADVAQTQGDIRITLYEGVVAEVSQTAQQAAAAQMAAR